MQAEKKKKPDSSLKLRNVFRVGIKGFFFSIIGEWAEKKLGEYVGVTPGSDMTTAFKLAKKQDVDVVVFGHTHRQCMVSKDGVTYINDGSVCSKTDSYPSVDITLSAAAAKVELVQVEI